MAHNKFTLAVKILSNNQKKDLMAFMQMPSNHLSNRDQELFQHFLNFDLKKAENVDETFWEAFLEESEKKNKNKIKSRLLRTLERYLSLCSLEEAEAPLAPTMLAIKYMESGLRKNGKFWIKKVRAILDSNVEKTLDNELIRFWLSELEVNATKDKRVKTSKIREMEEAIQAFYHINRLRLFCEKLNRSGIIDNDQELDQIRDQIKPDESSKESVLYYHISKMLVEKDVASYEYVRYFLREHHDFFSKKYSKEIYEYLLNFCIRKVNQGEKYYAKTYLDIIDFLEKEDMLLDMGKLGAPRFKNCVVASIIAGDLLWINQFTERYKNKNFLEESDQIKRKPFLDFNQALLELYAGNLEESRDLLTAFKHSNMYLKDIYYKIACDKLLLRIYFQNDEFHLIESQVDGIRKYIKINKKLTDSRKAPHLLFLSCLSKLRSMKTLDIEALKNKLLILDYNWLNNRVIKQGATIMEVG